MTITASPLTVTRKNAAVSASAWFHTTDPGEFTVDYPTGITGPATVTAAGSRAWGNMGSGGDYLARAGSEGNGRSDCTILVEFNADRLCASTGLSGTNAHDWSPLVGHGRFEGLRRVNWIIANRNISNGVYPTYVQSASSASNEAVVSVASAYAITGIVRLAVVLLDVAVSNNVIFYTNARTNTYTTARAATSGTMGGNEWLVMWGASAAAKIARQISDAELDAWFSSGTVPATNVEFNFASGQEINPTALVRYDISGNGYDLGTTGPPPLWPAPSAPRPVTSDTGFTSPLVEVPLTIAADCTAGVHNITLRRTRVGIPARIPALSDAVLYDDGTIPVTVIAETPAGKVGPTINAKVIP
jgi:hypothetical protein